MKQDRGVSISERERELVCWKELSPPAIHQALAVPWDPSSLGLPGHTPQATGLFWPGLLTDSMTCWSTAPSSLDCPLPPVRSFLAFLAHPPLPPHTTLGPFPTLASWETWSSH